MDSHEGLFQSSVQGSEAKSSRSRNPGHLHRFLLRSQAMLVRMCCFGLEAFEPSLTFPPLAVLGWAVTIVFFAYVWLAISCF